MLEFDSRQPSTFNDSESTNADESGAQGAGTAVRLTYQQEALWFLSELTGRSEAYNVFFAIRITGPLDLARLERSVRALIRRHESLRTVVAPGEHHPVLNILNPAAADRFALSIEEARPEEAVPRLECLCSVPFDLTHGPLLRGHLLTLQPAEHILALVSHHVAVDGWSLNVMTRDLGAFYDADGGDANLPSLSTSYERYAAAQRSDAARAARESDLSYWRERLTGLTTLDLPTDHVRPRMPSYSGRTVRFDIDPAVANALRAVGRANGATLFMTLLTAFQAFLSRYTCQRDIAVGIPVAGRSDVGLEPLVGYFVNTLVMRANLEGNPTFVELLEQVSDAVLDGLSHQDLPFDQLVAELSPTRDLSRNPLYQIAFALQTSAAPALKLSGLTTQSFRVKPKTAQFDLTLTIHDIDKVLEGELEYATDLFDASTIDRMVGHFQTWLASVAGNCNGRVENLPLISAAEREELISRWNDTAKPYPCDTAIPALFRKQVRLTPTAPAAVYGSEVLSYDELDRRSDHLAASLRQSGAVPGAVIGVCMDRSLELLVSLLAVLKSGAAFLPLDPEYPEERLRWMVSDAAAAVVMTQPALAARVTTWSGARPFALVVVPEAGGSPQGTIAIEDVNQPHHPAYVLYTSGSTGVPKGAVIAHRSLSNHELWFCDVVGLGPSDRVLQKTSISFDAMVPECFAALISGGAVVVAPPGSQRDQARLIEEIRAHQVTVVQWGPAELRALLDQPDLPHCTGLRQIISGGEALDRALALAVRHVLPRTMLGNFYGPTEATVDSAYFQFDQQLPDHLTVPIGQPVGNGELHVLDAHLEPVPVGVVGELYVGGVGLALGYLGREELTAERFISHPFRAGERLYRTGDLARRGPDGLVEYLGRVDRQIKLRGQRIELGEIEAALREAPGVHDAAVIVREDVPGVRVLVGYVVGETEDLVALQHGLRGRLPESMVPAAIVRIPDMPLLPNGKLDRSQLPAPPLGRDGSAFVPPRSPAEETVAAIWKSLLNIEAVGAHDDFFALGGHSLNATQVIARIKGTFGVELPLRVCFEARTLAELTAEILARRSADTRPVPAIEKRSGSGPAPVSFSQRRMWLLQQLEPGGSAYNMAMTVRLKGPLKRDHLFAALDRMVRRHEAFRTVFSMDDREPVAVIEEPREAQITEFDLSSTPRDEREAAAARLLAEFGGAPFDLSQGPLYRIALARLDPQDHGLTIVMHHVIGDDWSFGILRRELERTYNALLKGQEPVLPASDIEFSDYAAWQRLVLHDEVFEPQVQQWLERLKGAVPLNLPTDFGTTTRKTSHGSFVDADLSEDLRARLRSLCARYSVSPYMVTLAAFKLLLAKYCGQTDISLGTPVANRTRVEAEQVVGTLVNTLIVRTNLDGVKTFADALARVRESALFAFDRQDVPYDYLIDRVRDSNGRGADVHVLFNVLNTPNEEMQLTDVTSSYLSIDTQSVQFDLSMHFDLDVDFSAGLAYSSELFDRSTATRMLDNYLRLLDRVLDSPHAPLTQIGFASPAELATLERWNATSKDVPAPLTIHERFVEQSRRTPDAVALVQSAAGELTFSQLANRIHQLARVLRGRGIGRGDLVGLCVERGTAMLVSQMAILEAGAAYVPLDPGYPAARLQYMVEDAELALLVTESALAQSIVWPAERTLMVDVDLEWTDDAPVAPPERDAERDARPEDPAYVIYTSGSTGKPKGVVVHHRAVTNFLTSMTREPGMSPADRIVAVTTISFDIAVLELLLPLTMGATIILATREQAADGATLLELLEGFGGTIMQATPATWRMLIDAGWNGNSTFKALIGGEALPTDLSQMLLSRTGELWNMYGPTETTVWSTCWKVDPSTRGISIGTPVDNTQIYVLDGAGQRCPVGVAGEIVIGGLGVTLGYLRREALTAERFIPDTFSSTPGARMYRTGDSGRWRHDGLLEHLGRLDFQVKVRGHRIELGEIETALMGHPSVTRAVVIVREDRPGDARLVAYIVSQGDAVTGRDLRDHLRTTLPAYMLPQHYVELDDIPLLPNGKVNRHALPVPDESGEAAEREGAPALTATEEALAVIWRELLGVSSVRASDTFFDLGGHSLLAVRAVREMERRLGVHVDLRRLIFESLGQISESIDSGTTPPANLDDATATVAAVEEQSTSGVSRWFGRLKSTISGR